MTDRSHKKDQRSSPGNSGGSGYSGRSSGGGSGDNSGGGTGSGGGWVSVRPRFDDPLSWSFPTGLPTLRLHALFLLYALVMMAASFSPGKADSTLLAPSLMGIWLTCLLVAALVHEAGRLLMHRLTHHSPSDITLWPLGNLNPESSSPSIKHSLFAESGGLLANLTLCLLCATILGTITGQWLGVAIPNPLDLDAGMPLGGPVARSWPLRILYFLNFTSALIFLLNLLPMLPLSGGSILQAALGNTRQSTAKIGFITAILLGMTGAVMRKWEIIAIAGVGGLICRSLLLKMAYTDSILGRSETDEGTTGIVHDETTDLEIDIILEKISKSGMKGLTKSEKKKLKQATTQKQNP